MTNLKDAVDAYKLGDTYLAHEIITAYAEIIQRQREALDYVRYLCKPGYDSVDNMTAESAIEQCLELSKDTLEATKPENVEIL